MKLFVWDLHGVLEKGNEGAVLEISNEVLEQEGYSERFTTNDIHHMYGRKWYEYFAYLLPHEPNEKHLNLQVKCVAYQKGSQIIAKHIKPNDYVYEVLGAIAQKHNQILISNSDKESLHFFMNVLGILSYFNDKAFAANMHRQNAISKKDFLKSYVKDKNIENIVIIDDAPSNIDLLSVAGGIFYLYAHPGVPFKECKADYKIHDLREVLREV